MLYLVTLIRFREIDHHYNCLWDNVMSELKDLVEG